MKKNTYEVRYRVPLKKYGVVERRSAKVVVACRDEAQVLAAERVAQYEGANIFMLRCLKKA